MVYMLPLTKLRRQKTHNEVFRDLLQGMDGILLGETDAQTQTWNLDPEPRHFPFSILKFKTFLFFTVQTDLIIWQADRTVIQWQPIKSKLCLALTNQKQLLEAEGCQELSVIGESEWQER